MTADRASDPAGRLLARFAARRPQRAGSLIVSVFGDVAAPRGGALLLADLIALMAGFGVNESQVRTALSRLVADGWFETARIGRRGVYRLTAAGGHRVAEAARRIYGRASDDWDGTWTELVLPERARTSWPETRRALLWQGFGALARNVLVHPSPDAAALDSLLGDLPAGRRPLRLTARIGDADDARAVVAQCWDFAALAAAYRGFLAEFEPVAAALPARPLYGAAALRLRILLVHDWRRVLLRDPLLPPVLMGRDWIGRRAHDVARAVYLAVRDAAEGWADAHLHDGTGRLPPADLAVRFATAYGAS